MALLFEFDPKKSAANKMKHNVFLTDAVILWEDPRSVELEARSEHEKRWLKVGEIQGKIYSCFFTKRGEAIRLISFRRSRTNEEESFYETIKKEDNTSERT